MSTTGTLTVTPVISKGTSNAENKGKILFKREKCKQNVQKIKIDPICALEPARKKLCLLEAQRIMAVVEDTVKRTEIITLIPFVLENIDRFNVCFGNGLVEVLMLHKNLYENYNDVRVIIDDIQAKTDVKLLPANNNLEHDREDLHSRAENQEGSVVDALANGMPHTENMRSSDSMDAPSGLIECKRPDSAVTLDKPIDLAMKELSIVAERLSNSCKNVLRAFMNNPSAVNAVLLEFRNRNEACETFRFNLNELRNMLLNRLLTTPLEARERKNFMDDISQREKQNNKMVAKLESELNVNVSERDDEIRKRNEVISKLQTDIHHIERLSEDNLRRAKADADKQKETDAKNSESRRQKLSSEKQQQHTHFNNLKEEHGEMESSLRKKKYKVETEVENWIQKYDQDMGERQDEFEAIELVYIEEKKQLQELEERFKILEDEYNHIIEMRNKEREEREQKEREMHIMIRCATTIQAFWRSYKVRKMLKAKKKGKGKGKKKK